MCPVTAQPDYAQLMIEYVPDKHLAETKSVKLYLWKFRDEGAFNEAIIDRIASELFDQIKPLWLRVIGEFNPRGGICVTATAERGVIAGVSQTVGRIERRNRLTGHRDVVGRVEQILHVRRHTESSDREPSVEVEFFTCGCQESGTLPIPVVVVAGEGDALTPISSRGQFVHRCRPAARMDDKVDITKRPH